MIQSLFEFSFVESDIENFFMNHKKNFPLVKKLKIQNVKISLESISMITLKIKDSVSERFWNRKLLSFVLFLTCVHIILYFPLKFPEIPMFVLAQNFGTEWRKNKNRFDVSNLFEEVFLYCSICSFYHIISFG